MTIIIDGTVGANKGVVLDSNGKLPAIDGSQVTALSATQITTGTVATARLDTGTTAGKVLVLDGSGNMPAVDASLMTGVASATKSASNPTASTNPATGLGTKWINTTTGDVYILTDATAGANVWTNSGAGTGDITSWNFQGSSYGYICGGWIDASGTPQNYISNVIERYSFTTDGNASDVGDLFTTRYGTYGASSATHGYISGGYVDAGPHTHSQSIEKFSFATGTQNSADTGIDLSVIGNYGASCHTADYAYCVCGSETHPPGAALNTIQRFAFVNTATSTDVGDMTLASRHRGGCSSATHGYAMGGTSNNDTIDKFAFGSSATGSDVGNLIAGDGIQGGQSSTANGYASCHSSASLVINKFSFSSDGNATDAGDLTSRGSSPGAGASSSTTHGYTHGGGYPVVNVIDKFPFSTDANATDVGDMTVSRGYIFGGNVQI